jgi:membrane associated rhomboid family serine protease
MFFFFWVDPQSDKAYWSIRDGRQIDATVTMLKRRSKVVTSRFASQGGTRECIGELSRDEYERVQSGRKQIVVVEFPSPAAPTGVECRPLSGLRAAADEPWIMKVLESLLMGLVPSAFFYYFVVRFGYGASSQSLRDRWKAPEFNGGSRPVPGETGRPSRKGLPGLRQAAPLPGGETFVHPEVATKGIVAFPAKFESGWTPRGSKPPNSFNLGGKGEVAFDETSFRFKAKEYGTLWGGSDKEFVFPLWALRNASRDKSMVQVQILVESPGKAPWVARVAFWAKDEESAAQILARMPLTQTEDHLRRKREEAEFQQSLTLATPRVIITPALVAINAAIFVALALAGAGVIQPQGDVHFEWGSNLGLATAAGAWWRLFTSMFLHFGILHVAVNMAVLWGVGPVVERLYGHFLFLLIYVLSGMAGALASVLWHPEVNSAGASGAILGIVGASMACFLQRGNGIPRTVAIANVVVGVILVAGSILWGLAPGIDNIAHLGGLVAGFVLGHGLARPLEPAARVISGRNAAVSGAIIVALAALLALPVRSAIENARNEVRIEAEIDAFIAIERAAQAAAESISEAARTRALDRNAQANRLQDEVVKRYEEGYRRLADVPQRKASPRFALQQRIIRFAESRLSAYRTMVEAIRANDAGSVRKAEELLKEGNRIASEPL